MKTNITFSPEPAFEPFTFSIKVETLEEALALRALHGAGCDVADAVMEVASHLEGRTQEEIRRTYVEAFYPIHQHLEATNHI